MSRILLLLLASAAVAAPAAAQLAWSTYVGGASDDALHDVAIGADGHIWAVGESDSTDLPDASEPRGGRDALVVELSADGAQRLRVVTFGGSGDERGRAIALDGAGHVYVAGDTTSDDFPSLAPLQAAPGGGRDAFLVRLDAATGAIDRATRIGGSGDDGIGAIAVNAAGEVALHGETTSPDFPAVAPLQASLAGETDAFLAKLAPGGALLFATYLGGTALDEPDGVGFGVALDAAGSLHACGTTHSFDFPVANAMQPLHGGGGRDAYFAKLTPAGDALVYSTFFGRAAGDSARACALARDGTLAFAGTSRSPDLPLVAPLQWTKRESYDLLVGRLAADGSQLSFATYWGRDGGEGAKDLALDAAGDFVVVGPTESAALPLVDPSQPSFGGFLDAFVAKFSASGSAPLSVTYHGGAGNDAPFEEGAGVAIAPDGSIVAVGTTDSVDLPVVQALDATLDGARDGWIARFAPPLALELEISGDAPPLATLRVRNPGTVTASLQVKVWIEVPAAGITSSVSLGANALPTLAAGEERVLLDRVALPGTLPFPGTTLSARVLDPRNGAIRAERRCSTRPCPVTP